MVFISYFLLFLISYFLFLISYFLFLISCFLFSFPLPLLTSKNKQSNCLGEERCYFVCSFGDWGYPLSRFPSPFPSPFFLPIPSNPLSDASSFPLLDPFCVFFAFMTSLNRLLLRCVLFSYFFFRIFFLFSLSLFSFSNSNLLGINISFFWSMREHLLLNKPSTCLSSALRLTSTNGPG